MKTFTSLYVGEAKIYVLAKYYFCTDRGPQYPDVLTKNVILPDINLVITCYECRKFHFSNNGSQKKYCNDCCDCNEHKSYPTKYTYRVSA